MNRKMTRLAWGAKCGSLGDRGSTGLGAPHRRDCSASNRSGLGDQIRTMIAGKGRREIM